jgi:hypothetical protein
MILCDQHQLFFFSSCLPRPGRQDIFSGMLVQTQAVDLQIHRALDWSVKEISADVLSVLHRSAFAYHVAISDKVK